MMLYSKCWFRIQSNKLPQNPALFQSDSHGRTIFAAFAADKYGTTDQLANLAG